MAAWRRTGVVLLALGVAGCGMEGAANPTSPQWRSINESVCRSYGYVAGTPDWAHCLMQVDMDRRAMAIHILSE